MAGAVRSPGVYELASGARVIDGLRAAGGPAPDADVRTINLARVLSDAGLRGELRRRGLARAGFYTADRTAGRVLELLARVAGSRG